MARLFVSQGWIDHENVEDRITVQNDVMTVKADGKTYQLAPAVHFLQVEGGEGDPHQLLGKVKTEEQLVQMNAEAMAESVIYGDIAYRVAPGFVADYTGADSPISAGFR